MTRREFFPAASGFLVGLVAAGGCQQGSSGKGGPPVLDISIEDIEMTLLGAAGEVVIMLGEKAMRSGRLEGIIVGVVLVITGTALNAHVETKTGQRLTVKTHVSEAEAKELAGKEVKFRVEKKSSIATMPGDRGGNQVLLTGTTRVQVK